MIQYNVYMYIYIYIYIYTHTYEHRSFAVHVNKSTNNTDIQQNERLEHQVCFLKRCNNIHEHNNKQQHEHKVLCCPCPESR